MAKHKRILYLLFDGLLDTVIESQVLLHARDMKKHGIAELEIWVVAWSGVLYKQAFDKQAQAECIADAKIKIIKGLRPGIPFSGIINFTILYIKIRTRVTEFSHIHGRSDYGGMLASILGKVTGITSIWDCRGNAQAEIIASNPRKNLFSLILLKMKLLRAKISWFIAAKYSDKASFVTKKLSEKYLPYLSNKKFELIPCLCSSDVIFYNPMLRNKARVELGIEEDEKVFVYSGSLVAYQCFDEMLNAYIKVKNKNIKARLLILTPYINSAKEKINNKGIIKAILINSTLEKMNEYLNAADYAFMLRKYNEINSCAFPTKFIEYGLAGLPVIMNKSVPDCYEYAVKNKNLIEYDKNEILINENYDRKKISHDYEKTLTRLVFLRAYKELYL
jgi:glycosyltransferase involved in cell wall biosynthesis